MEITPKIPKMYTGRRFLANMLQDISTQAKEQGDLKLALEACRLLLVVQHFVKGKQTKEVSKALDKLLAGTPSYTEATQSAPKF